MSISGGLLMLTGSAEAADSRVPAFVSAHKVVQEERHIAHLKIAALTQLVGHVSGYILRPLLSGVEGNDADRAFILTFEQTDDDGFQIGRFEVGFTIDTTIAAKIIDHEVHVLIVALRDNRRRRARSR